MTRSGIVNLNRSSLFVNSSKQGHIGSMVVTGVSELNVFKGESTSPLKVDGTVTVEQANPLRINATKDGSSSDNKLGDKILEFKNAKNAVKNSYVDGSNNTTKLSVGKQKEYILFKDSTAHEVSSWVEYPGAEDEALTDKLDVNVNKESVQKILHFDYDEDNTDAVRDGYVIAMPKTVIATGDATEQMKYSQVDSKFCTEGTFSDAFDAVNGGAFTEGTDFWRITFTKNVDGNGATGVTTKDGQTTAIPVDNNKYVYIAHIVCDAAQSDDRERDITTFIVDTSAPKQETEATKVEQIDFDGITENNEYTLSVTDPTLTENELPVKDSNGTQMTYIPSGISQVFWAVGDINGNAKADAQAAKRVVSDDQISQDGTGLNGTGTATVDGKMKLTIPKVKIDQAKEQKQNLWVYVKDSENNTTKMMINLDEDVINVKVPMKVSVVAVKKPNGGTCELLAPTCYVVNNGSKEVIAEVNGFTTTMDAENLKLSEDKASYTASEIALQLLSENGDNAGKKTNVLSINKNPLGIGTMDGANGTSDKNLKYTFDAAYNVTDINVPDGYIFNTMSYHFTVKN